ncbi:MAG: hypothetical protein KGJ78_00210 [Alphaproteobacteria bacterium]|nr:hypothetical protein [Alphaproteobacteria bacterium]
MKSVKSAGRQARLAAALRENLKRRKAARRPAGPDPAEEGEHGGEQAPKPPRPAPKDAGNRS